LVGFCGFCAAGKKDLGGILLALELLRNQVENCQRYGAQCLRFQTFFCRKIRRKSSDFDSKYKYYIMHKNDRGVFI
jgi:hypothetical protein